MTINKAQLKRLITLLTKKATPQKELMHETGMCTATIGRWLRLFSGNLPPGTQVFSNFIERHIFVEKWENHGRIKVPYWRWGWRVPDAPKPRPLTPKEHEARRRIRNKVKAFSAKKQGPQAQLS